MASNIQTIVKNTLGISLPLAVVGVLALAALGAATGIMFPKYQANAMLEFPDKRANKPIPGLKTPDLPNNAIDLSLYKRVESSYDSPEQLQAWLQSIGKEDSAAGRRLVVQAEMRKFWTVVSVPVLPFSKQDQRTYGEIKDAASTQLLGVQLTTDARTGDLASEMLGLMAKYYSDAVIRERIRAWAVDGRVDAQGTAQALRAEIVKAELEISLAERRAADMRAILARHPEASRMESRQVVNVNEAEGGERYLSPTAQAIAAEVRVSQLREDIRRLDRGIQQRELLVGFYGEAAAIVEKTLDVNALLASLRGAAERTFSGADKKQEWVKEASLRVRGALDNFDAMQTQFGVRNGVSISGVANRAPLRLALFGVLGGLALLGGLAFLRVGLRSLREEQAHERSMG